jgi:biopolymer transport protein ExbB/TolQ
MNKINPLYLIALFLVFLGLSLYKLSQAKSEFKEAQESFNSNYELAHDLQALRSVYEQKEQQQRALDLLLQHATLKEANMQKEQKKSSWHVSSSSINQKALDFFLGKVLNASYPIKSYVIEKIDDEKAKIDMEIQW